MHASNQILTIKEGDTRPTLEYRPEDVDDLLNAAEVRIYMQHEQTGDLIVNDTATIEDATTPLLTYQLQEYQTARVGRHHVEFVIHRDGGGIQSTPSSSFLAVDIYESTDRDVDPSEFDTSDGHVTTLYTDNIRSESGGDITVHDRTQFTDGALISDLDISENADGTEVTLSYAGTPLRINDQGISVPEPTQDSHIARLGDVSTSGGTGDVQNPMQAHLDANGYTIENLPDPIGSTEAATKGYVDTEVSSVSGGSGGSTNHNGVVYADEEGYPGDLSGGDIALLIEENPDKKIVLPPGQYSLESTLSYDGTSNRDLVHIVGEPEATIVVNTSIIDRFFQLGTTSAPFGHVRLENLTLNLEGAPEYNATWGRLYVDGSVYTENLKIEGVINRADYSNDRYALLSNMMDESAVAIHRGLHFGQGEVHDTTVDNVGQTIAFAAEEAHVGTNILIGCHVNEFADNGYYVKDGVGANLLLGSTAHNCGGANFRLGINDVAVGCESVWDAANPSELKNGVCLDSDESNGTAVLGFRVVKESGTNDCVRFRSSAESLTFRDLYIRNETSQWTLSARGTGNAIALLDNCTIVDNGDTSVRGEAVELRQSNIHLRNCSITCSTTSWRAAIGVTSGSCRITECDLEVTGPDYAVVADAVDRVTITNTTMNGGIHLDSTAQPNALEVKGCDLRNVTTLFTGAEPNPSEFVWWQNLGYLENIDYGELFQNRIVTEEVESKRIGNRVYADHPDFATVQAAIDYADANGAKIVELPPGPISEDLTLPALTRLHGNTISRSNAGQETVLTGTISSTAGGIEMIGIELDGATVNIDTGTAGVMHNFENIALRNGATLTVNARMATLRGLRASSDGEVILGADSAGCVVIGARGVTVTDNGVNNQIIANT